MFAEIFLSIFDREEILVRGDDPVMVYSLIPEKSGTAMTPEYRVNVTIDSYGMRNCRKPYLNLNNSLLILGDSFSEGWGVDCEKSFPGILSASFPDFQIWNGGAHGGSLSYYILRSRYYNDIVKPTHLLLQIFDNDLDDLDKIHEMITFDSNGFIVKANPKGLIFIPPGKLSSFIKNLSLFRFTKRLVSKLKGIPTPIKYYSTGREPEEATLSHEDAVIKYGKLEYIKNISEEYNGQFEFYKYNKNTMPEAWKSKFSRFELYLNQFYSEAISKNPDIKIAILYIPAKEVFAEGGIDGSFKNKSGKFIRRDINSLETNNELFILLKNFSSYKKVKLINGLNIYYENPESLYFPGDAHLNSAGHAVTADAVKKWILEK